MATAWTPRPPEPLLLALLLGGAGCQEYVIASSPPDVDPSEVTACDFTPIPGTRAARYDCNPVFSEADLDVPGFLGSTTFHAQEVLGHAFYQMWYVLHPEAGERPYTLRYAISADGVTWEDHPDNPGILEATPGTWDDDDMQGARVVWDPAEQEYVLLYQGLNIGKNETKLGAFTSRDGLAWSPTPNSPVLDLTGTTRGQNYCWPLALTKERGRFAGYIAAGPEPTADLSTYVCEIHRFTTVDIRDTSRFRQQPRPVLRAGPEDYDRQGMTDAAVVELDGTFYMFYVGFREWTDNGNGWISATFSTLNLATSPDGVTWTKDPDNPIAVHASEPGRVSGVAAQVIGKRVHLWVTDHYAELEGRAIGYFLYEPDAAPHP